MLCTRIITRLSQGKCNLPIISSQLHASNTLRGYHHNGQHTTQQPGTLTNTTQPEKLLGKFLQQIRLTQCYYCNSNTPGATSMVTADGQQAKAATTSHGQQGGILKRVLNKVGFTPNSKARLKVTSHLLYESVVDKINYIYFFRDFNLPNTFNSWFLVSELHVWMLLVRAMAEGSESGEDGRFLRNSIVEAMWSDVNTRAKKLGANNPSRTRQQIETLSEQFQAALIAYDEGIMSDDRVLAAALWRRFFEMNCDDYEQIERLVKYVRVQMSMLDKMTRDEFLQKPNVPWVPLEKVVV